MNNAEKMVMVPREWLNSVALLQMPLDELQEQAVEFLCEPCEHHGEPVAGAEQWYADTPDGDSALVIRVAACANPAEVERLRAENERLRERVTPTHKSLIGKHAEIIKERDALRAQLAEAHALLREARKFCNWPRHPLPEKIYAALSGSAEPSAPVENDERKEFEKAVIDKAERFHPELRQYGDQPDAEYRDANIEWAWGLWQTRAALGRKP